jgi:hypothetical protein
MKGQAFVTELVALQKRMVMCKLPSPMDRGPSVLASRA